MSIFSRYVKKQYKKAKKHWDRSDLGRAGGKVVKTAAEIAEANKKYADYFDSLKYNVAVVFKEGLPKIFRGLRVIDGDKTDMRFLDGDDRVVVGL